MPDKQAMHVTSWIFTLVRGIASCYRSNQQLCGDYEPQSKQYGRTLFAVQKDKKEYTQGVSGVPYRRLERGALEQKQKKGGGSMNRYCLVHTRCRCTMRVC
jgi:hypothetical protein